MRRTFFELGSLAGLVIIAAVLSQLFFPNRISFFTKYVETEGADGSKLIPAILLNSIHNSNSQPASSDLENIPPENPATISTGDVYELFQGKSAIIIDARDLEAYESGHITGAWNIPYHKFLDRLELLDPLPLDTLIITYCDGEDCNASIELANALVSMGFSNIRYYFGGWNAWLKDNYPITSGSAQ